MHLNFVLFSLNLELNERELFGLIISNLKAKHGQRKIKVINT